MRIVVNSNVAFEGSFESLTNHDEAQREPKKAREGIGNSKAGTGFMIPKTVCFGK